MHSREGSVLWFLIYHVLPNEPSDNMSVVWSMILDAYAELSVDSQVGNLLISLFTNPEKHRDHYPKLKGKANEIIHVLSCSFFWSQLAGLLNY